MNKLIVGFVMAFAIAIALASGAPAEAYQWPVSSRFIRPVLHYQCMQKYSHPYKAEYRASWDSESEQYACHGRDRKIFKWVFLGFL